MGDGTAQGGPVTEMRQPPATSEPPLVCLVGPTAVGKTESALGLAEALGAEIVNADSRQVYRRMDLGTAKPTAEERARVPHHLIDVVDPDQPFSAGDFVRLADAAIADIRARGRVPLVVGGTGLYVRALVDGIWHAPSRNPALRAALAEVRGRRGTAFMHRFLARLDPDSAGLLHANDRHKVDRALEITLQTGWPASALRRDHGFPGRYPAVHIGLRRPRGELYERINSRVEQMISAGWLDEVRSLVNKGYGAGAPGMNAVGYRELVRVLNGEWTIEQASGVIQKGTRNYAKRQFTWFNKDARLRWLDVSCTPPADLLASLLSMCHLAGVMRVNVSVCKTP